MAHTMTDSRHRGWRTYIWPTVLLSSWLAAVVVLACVGYARNMPRPDFWDRLYSSLQLFVLHGERFPPNLSWSSNWPLETARFLAPAGELGILGIGLAELFMLWSDRFRLALFSLSRRKHTVVCGMGTKGLQLVRDLRRAGHRVLVIEKDRDNPFVAACDALGAVVLIGDSTNPETLRQARLEHAESLVAVSGQDGANVEIAVRAHQLLSHIGRPATRTLPCYLHIVDLELRTLLRQHRALAQLPSGLDVEIFNVFENGARLLLRNHFLDYDKAISEENDPRQAHLIVVGFGNVGESVVLQAVKLAHFPNEKKLRLTVIEKEAELRRRRFLVRYPSFEELCETSFMACHAEDPLLLAKMEAWCKERNSIVTLVVCFDDDSHSLSFAFSLLNTLRSYAIPIFVRIESDTGLAQLVADVKRHSTLPRRIYAFSKIEDACSLEVVVHERLNQFAQKIHDGFRRKRKQQSDYRADDPAVRPWKELDPDFKDSNWQQAEHIPLKLRAIDCWIGPPSALPNNPPGERVDSISDEDALKLAKIEHRRWFAERRLAGWQWGAQKNVEARTNPNMVPWSKLKPDVQKYDLDAVRLIPELVRLDGQVIYRKPATSPKSEVAHQEHAA